MCLSVCVCERERERERERVRGMRKAEGKRVPKECFVSLCHLERELMANETF